MKKLLVPALITLLSTGGAGLSTEVKHCFIAVDNGNNTLRYVNQFDRAKDWTVATDGNPRDIRLAPEGKTFLVSVDKGAVEYDAATGMQTGFAITNQNGIQSAQKLNDDHYLLATANRIFVCDPKGEILNTIPTAAGSQPYIRLVTVTQEGSLLYTALKPFCINEISMKGEPLAKIMLPDKSYKAVRLENGNYLASSGDSVSVFEVSPRGEIMKTYGGRKKHPQLDLTFNSGWQKLENGNVVATCWHGHGYTGSGPHLVEYTSDNEVVWTWYDPEAKQITNVLLLK